MTAPDRIWISADELGRKVETFLCSSDSYYADNLGEVEYIRKGAFPVEEIRGFVEKWSAGYSASDLGRDHSPACPAMLTTVGQCSCERGLMRRILSLLEGANGGMGDE